MNKVFLIEDHDEALEVWRKKRIKAFDLVHIDAHLDFGMHLAKPIQKIFNEAGSLKELKRNLEQSLSFMHYEKDFDKQTNIGNYIYPAMQDGIVNDFYWIVPGRLKEFKESSKFIKNILKGFLRRQVQRLGLKPQVSSLKLKKGIISTNLFGRKFIICIIEKLPVLKQKALLDIDTDFLVIDSLINANNTAKIGERKPWILPKDLVEILKQKIKRPEVITVAYSVNGGYTPIRYKHLGDELAYYFAPREFKNRLENNYKVAAYFNRFVTTGRKEYYRKAIALNSTYRAQDNNYGPLYLSLRKFFLAKKEFLKVLKVDPKNPSCFMGLGNIALGRKDFKKAKTYFTSALRNTGSQVSFSKVKNQSLFGLAEAEFNLKNFAETKKLLMRYQAIEPLRPQSYYLLGRIFEKEKDFMRAVNSYKDALRLGFGGIEPIQRLLKISYYLKEKDDLIKYIIPRYKAFKKEFLRTKKLSSAKGKIRNWHKVKEKIRDIEKMLTRRG